MAFHSLERASVEERRLLMSTSFELEDVGASEQSHKRTALSSEDRLDSRRAWKRISTRSKLWNTCVGLAAAMAVTSIILLLVILGYDEAVYRAQRHMIDKALLEYLSMCNHLQHQMPRNRTDSKNLRVSK